MNKLFYSQVEGVPGSRTIFFVFLVISNINYLLIYLSTILMFDFFFFHIYLSSFIYLFPYLFIYLF